MPDRYRAIEDHAVIGDLHAVALVATDGTIDWCCLPRFDSPAVFVFVLEGATKFHTNRVRAAKKRGEAAPADPLARQIPADPKGLADVTVWSRDNFMPYLGKSFAEIRDAVTDTIRNAVAHISPNMDLRIADYAADFQACRTITPVLRYMVRDLIHEELASLSGADLSASSPAA